MLNFVKSLKNGQIQRNVEKYFVSRKMKNEKFKVNQEKNCKFF